MNVGLRMPRRMLGTVAAVCLAGMTHGRAVVGSRPLGNSTRGGQTLSGSGTSRARSLPWNDINIVSLTDVHGWVDGHRHPDNTPRLDADYGDLISFRHHMEAEADRRGKDILYLNSGDLVDGRGISDATDPKGKVFFKLLQQVPFDAYGIGNHELYDASTPHELVDSGFVRWLDGGYVTSNVVWASGENAGAPIGSRYKLWTGPRSGVKVLVLGFLYDFKGAASVVDVIPVAEAVGQSWVESALREEDLDAVVVLAHMDLRDALVSTIVTRIRTTLPATPIQVLNGHTHYRGFNKIDDNAAGLEAGKYFDTVGWVSFQAATRQTRPAAPKPEDLGAVAVANVNGPALAGASTDTLSREVVPVGEKRGSTTWFDFEYVDATRAALAAAAGVDVNDFATVAGEVFREEVELARVALGLNREIGCSPRDYSRTADFDSEDSAYGLMMRDVNPVSLFLPERNMTMVSIQSVGSIRYDLYAGAMTVDDTITVSPFGDPYFRLPRLTGPQIAATISALSGEAVHPNAATPEVAVLGTWVHSEFEKTGGFFDVVTVEYDVAQVAAAVHEVTGRQWEVEPYRHDDLDTTTVWEKFIEAEWPLPCRAVHSGA